MRTRRMDGWPLAALRLICLVSLAAGSLRAEAAPAGPAVFPSVSLLQPRYALTPRAVALALSAGGMHVSGGQVLLLARVVATTPDPALDIKSVDRWGSPRSGPRSKVKLTCHLPGECIPFYAIVSGQVGDSPHTTLEVSGSDGAEKTKRKADAEITMRAGSHATLVMDGDRAHIEVAVISLEAGIAGHRIRVASADRKQIYVAEVISARQLKGSF